MVTQTRLVELSQSAKHHKSLPLALVKEKVLLPEQFLSFCADVFDLDSIDLDAVNIDDIPRINDTEKLIQKYLVLPVYLEQQKLILATSDPSDLNAQDNFEFNLGLQTSLVVCDPIKLETMIHKLFTNETQEKETIENFELERFEIESLNKEDINIKSDAPIVLYVNKILLDAIKRGASDIHFEPYESDYRIRYRIDGVLNEASRPPPELAPRLAARIKVISNMDIAEKRNPQDGRLKLRLALNHVIEFRVSTLPTIWGEKVVMRLLHSASTSVDLDNLGFEPEQKKLFVDALHQPQGLILVTGPTGSGKSLSLYTGLNLLNTEQKNISTAEDPVEIHLHGINQVQVNPKAGLDFSSALRAFLRQDPDVLMVGEIRDFETAEIAIKSSQTGHLVLSTLHTNSAAETLNRLSSMGVAAYNIASSISLIMAQRLVRCLCPFCKEVEQNLPIEELLNQGFLKSQLTDAIFYQAKGCGHCHQGYKGRTGIFEVVKPSATLRQIIMEGGEPLEIAKQTAKENIINLREAGLLKVLSGQTSLSEINRVTRVN